MIITGSARSVLVKLAYQSGFRAPLTVTLLYLAGQFLSLVVYVVQKRVIKILKHGYTILVLAEDPIPNQPLQTQKEIELRPKMISTNRDQPIPKGSSHGLTVQSHERIQWIHHIPWYAKPGLPALFNLLNAALRWVSLLHIDASVAEMLISGLELTLSVVAAKVFRCRRIGKTRWIGVVLVALGICIIERTNNTKTRSNLDRESTKYKESDVVLGVILIILQSILSVLQDIAEEVFMQAADFPPTMMLGMEGMYGFIVGLVLYFSIGSMLLVEDTNATAQLLRENVTMRYWIFCLPPMFLLTGIFNIKATEVTSAMTRNVWKNIRTALVWIISLCIFYFGGNSEFGEAWLVPESYFILLGMMVMSTGITIYYWYKQEELKVECLVEEETFTEENNLV